MSKLFYLKKFMIIKKRSNVLAAYLHCGMLHFGFDLRNKHNNILVDDSNSSSVELFV